MGYGQFMPDSYRDYAVDFDNDGVRDILNNPVDAIGSVANFLNKKGKWKPNVPIAMRAKAISEVKEIKSSFKPYMTEIELENLGRTYQNYSVILNLCLSLLTLKMVTNTGLVLITINQFPD